jgi:hypothetical protein
MLFLMDFYLRNEAGRPGYSREYPGNAGAARRSNGAKRGYSSLQNFFGINA